MVQKGKGQFRSSKWIIYLETQGNDRNCGKHVVNNILQAPTVTLQLMHAASKKLDGTEAMIQGYNPSQRESENASADGFFNVQVLEVVLMSSAGINLVPYGSLSNQEKNSPTRFFGSFLINRALHWYSYRRIKGVWFLLDSLKSSPILVEEKEVLFAIKSLTASGNMVFGLIKGSGEDIGIADAWYHDLSMKHKLHDGCKLTEYDKVESRYIVENSNNDKMTPLKTINNAYKEESSDKYNDDPVKMKEPITIRIIDNGKKYTLILDMTESSLNIFEKVAYKIQRNSYSFKISSSPPQVQVIHKTKDKIFSEKSEEVINPRSFFKDKESYRIIIS